MKALILVFLFVCSLSSISSITFSQTGHGPANGWTVKVCLPTGCPPDSNFATTFFQVDSGYQSFNLRKRETAIFENKSHQMGPLGDSIVIELKGNTNYFSNNFGGLGFYLYFTVADLERQITTSFWWYVVSNGFSEVRFPTSGFNMQEIYKVRFSFGTSFFDSLSQNEIESLVQEINIRRAYMIMPDGKKVDFPHFQYTTSVVDEIEEGIAGFELFQNYPNPFNPSTVISYQLAVDSKVSLRVYDVLGNEVATLVNEEKSAGSYEVAFNASKLPSGVYFYKLQAGVFVQTRKMILMK